MDTNIEIPVSYNVISIFIGYLYFYLSPLDYKDILTIKTVKLGLLSGLILSFIIILAGLISGNALTLDNFIVSMVLFGVPCIVMDLVLVMVGGLCALTIKNLLKKIHR
jgi:hypothetical protein